MDQSNFSFRKSLIGWAILTLFSSVFIGFLGQKLARAGILEGQMQPLTQGIVFCALVIPGLYLIRKYLDHFRTLDLGLDRFSQAIFNFAKGLGILVVPILTAALLSQFMGWSEFSIHMTSEIAPVVLTAFIAVIIHEAIPEELLFRGYLYGILKDKSGKWIGAAITVLLFVLWPVMVVPIQKYVLGMDISIGGADGIYAGYIMWMFIFGCFTMALRVLSGTIWIGVGFHCGFVFMNKVFGPTSASIIQMSDLNQGPGFQITLLASFLMMAIVVLRQAYLSAKNRDIVYIKAPKT